jgi:hypothetical protein
VKLLFQISLCNLEHGDVLAVDRQLTIDKNGKICQIELDISVVMERVSEGERPIMLCDNRYGGQYSKHDLIICKSVSPFQLFVTCLYIVQ